MTRREVAAHPHPQKVRQLDKTASCYHQKQSDFIVSGKEIIVLFLVVFAISPRTPWNFFPFNVQCAMCINLAMFHASVSMFYVHLLFNGPISDVHQIWFGIAEKSGREGEKLCGGFQALRDEQLDRKVETNTNSHFGQQ